MIKLICVFVIEYWKKKINKNIIIKIKYNSININFYQILLMLILNKFFIKK